MIELTDKNGNNVVCLDDCLFPLKFRAMTISGEKIYRIRIIYTENLDPMRASFKIKGAVMDVENPKVANNTDT